MKQPSDLKIQVVRSARRRKIVSARLLNWSTLEVRAPANMPEDALRGIIQQFVGRTLKRRGRQRRFASDAGLQRLAERLNKVLFGGRLSWRSIRYVSNQRQRFGSCSPAQGTIRISDRLVEVPEFVLSYVVAHELAHLLERNHSPSFWRLVSRYDRVERAIGYLMALQLTDDVVDDGQAPEKTTAGA